MYASSIGGDAVMRCRGTGHGVHHAFDKLMLDLRNELPFQKLGDRNCSFLRCCAHELHSSKGTP